jgi:tetratricopeptide (TPR) repeat protein
MTARAPTHLVYATLTASALLLGLLAGCKTDEVINPEPRPAMGPVTSLEDPPGVELPNVPVADRNEVDLVEEMILHRAMYARLLRVLATYYTEHGYPEKAQWAISELNDLKKVKPYRYIIDAEVPVSELQPAESISEADALYNDAMALMKKAGHGTPVFFNQATMRQALAKLKELVDRYPTSDKIDDAAFYIGEIHKEYEQEADNSIALEWYKKAIEWNPDTPHPARFRIATTYDYRLHERENALFWYQEALEKEAKFDGLSGEFAMNKDYAAKRIRELTPEKQERSPSEVVADVRPQPSNSALPQDTAPPSEPSR